jgi:hypothetical protein
MGVPDTDRVGKTTAVRAIAAHLHTIVSSPLNRRPVLSVASRAPWRVSETRKVDPYSDGTFRPPSTGARNWERAGR